jgi:hypothetical protein
VTGTGRRLALPVLLLALAAPCAVPAQTATAPRASSPAAGPAEVAREFFDALAAQRWRDAVAYVDTAAFEMVRRDELARDWQMRAAEQESPAARDPQMMVRAMMQSDPKMPREVAEYFVRQVRESRRHSHSLIGMDFARVPTADSLERLPTTEAAARWLEAHDEMFQFRQERDERRARGCPELPSDAELDRPRPHVVLGAVVLGDTAAYVLHRDPARGAEMAAAMGGWRPVTPEVLPLRRVAGQWRVHAGAVAHEGRITIISGDSAICGGKEK